MLVQPPILDERTLVQLIQQLFDEADKAFNEPPTIPRWQFAKQLTESQVRELLSRPFDDAGLMLSFIFARLMEFTLQRLNRVPEKSLLAFLDTMGVSLLPPSPARAPLTFALTPGTPPTLVPKGTQAIAQAGGQQTAVIFETEDDLTIIPSQLTTGYTMDPQWDRYTNQSKVIGGESPIGFTPFVGLRRMPHILYLGDEVLLNFSRAMVEIKHMPATLPPLLWQYRNQGSLKPAPHGGTSLVFAIQEMIDQELIQGIGLTSGVFGRWLRAVLTTPFPDDLVAQVLRLGKLRLKVSASGLPPDFAFSNTAPVDLTKDFLPFGDIPKVGDTFYISSQDAFSKPDANVTLTVTVKPRPDPKITWEYWSGKTWTPLIQKKAGDPNPILEPGDGG